MTAVRPEFFMVLPEDIARHGGDAACLLALVRYATDRTDERNGRVKLDGEIWWRASHSDIGASLGGLKHDRVRRIIERLESAGELVSCHRWGGDDRTRAYRTSDQSKRESTFAQDKPQSANANPRRPKRASTFATTSLENLETKEPPTGVRNPQGEEPVQLDPNQDGLPGMHLLPLPRDHAPEPVPERVIAPAENGARGHRLPENWLPPQEVIAQMQDECPHVNQEIEYRKFCDYWHDQPGAKGRKVNWVGTYRNWIRKAASDYPPPRGRSGLSAVDEKALGWQGVGR